MSMPEEDVIKLFQMKGLKYLPHPVFEGDILTGFNPLETAYYRENREEFEDLTARYGDDIRFARIAPVKIRDAGEMGLGTFAAEPIPAGRFIGEYTGIVRETEEVYTDPDDEGGTPVYATDYSWNYPDCIEDLSLEIDATHSGNEMRFVNHNFNPNVLVEHTVVDGRWAVFFIALRDIAGGEQLFVDYGEEYWSGGNRILVL